MKSNIFIAIGLLFLGIFAQQSWLRYAPVHETVVYSQELQTAVGPAYPTYFVIDSLKLALPIVNGYHSGDTWTTNQNGVSFYTDSTYPGEVGNSIFYGHNYQRVLGNLHTVTPGDTIKISYSDGSFKKFEVVVTQVVDPDALYILNGSNDRMLTVYTCVGLFDQKRFVVAAKLIES